MTQTSAERLGRFGVELERDSHAKDGKLLEPEGLDERGEVPGSDLEKARNDSLDDLLGQIGSRLALLEQPDAEFGDGLAVQSRIDQEIEGAEVLGDEERGLRPGEELGDAEPAEERAGLARVGLDVALLSDRPQRTIGLDGHVVDLEPEWDGPLVGRGAGRSRAAPALGVAAAAGVGGGAGGLGANAEHGAGGVERPSVRRAGPVAFELEDDAALPPSGPGRGGSAALAPAHSFRRHLPWIGRVRGTPDSLQASRDRPEVVTIDLDPLPQLCGIERTEGRLLSLGRGEKLPVVRRGLESEGIVRFLVAAGEESGLFNAAVPGVAFREHAGDEFVQALLMDAGVTANRGREEGPEDGERGAQGARLVADVRQEFDAFALLDRAEEGAGALQNCGIGAPLRFEKARRLRASELDVRAGLLCQWMAGVETRRSVARTPVGRALVRACEGRRVLGRGECAIGMCADSSGFGIAASHQEAGSMAAADFPCPRSALPPLTEAWVVRISNLLAGRQDERAMKSNLSTRAC